MKQFNLEEYLRLKEEGKEPKIVTRDGDSVRIICTDRINDCNMPIVALIDAPFNEIPVILTKEGRLSNEAEACSDIFFAQTKHEGWINIYRGANDARHLGGILFNTEQEAMDTASIGDSHNHIATIKVEWEE